MGNIIKRYLEKAGMQQKDLAKYLNITCQAVSKWIAGDGVPSFDSILKMTELFGLEFGNEMLKKGIQETRIMKKQHSELKDLSTSESAEAETKLLLDEMDAQKYSHATYVLLSWLLQATIGLTYHGFINKKNKEDRDLYYEDIFFHLNNYFETCRLASYRYPNELSYEFFLMGGDLFESCEPYKLPNHDYCRDSMGLWYAFEKAIRSEGENSSLLSEFNVALIQLISENSCY